MTNLSDHLTLAEFVFSNTANRENIDNTLPENLIDTAIYTAQNLFEPIRALLGDIPIKIDSGYRCEALNVAVRGVSTSQHIKAEAIDMVPDGMTIYDAFTKIKESNLVWDQLICEHDTSGHLWIHASITNGTNRQDIIPSLLKKNS